MKLLNNIKNEQLINLRNYINVSSQEEKLNLLFEDETQDYIRLVKV